MNVTATQPTTIPTTPITTPGTQPFTEPVRRMEPDKVCPAQRVRIGETIRRMLP